MEKTAQRNARIERGQTNLIVPTSNREISYVHPSFGPNTYTEVGKQILEAGYKVPTGDLTVPLVHTAYLDDSVKNEPEFENVREIMKNRWLWVFNRNIWIPEGVYVIPDENALGRNAPFSIEELEDKLSGADTEFGVRFSQDRKTRFAPKESYGLGVHTPDNLARDGFVVANYGVEGASQLAEVSRFFRNNPKTYGVEVAEGQNPEQRVASLDSYWDLDVGGLYVYGDNWDGYRNCYAFGVSGVSEANDAAKMNLG